MSSSGIPVHLFVDCKLSKKSLKREREVRASRNQVKKESRNQVKREKKSRKERGMFEVIKYFCVTSIDQTFKQNMQVELFGHFLCSSQLVSLVWYPSKTREVRAFKPSMIITSEFVKTIN